MAVDCQNIYKNARKSAGMTQEKAAQLLNVSVDSLRDYEQSQRPVPSDVASAMCDVYQAPYLAVQHLRLSSELGKRVVPEIQLKDLPEAGPDAFATNLELSIRAELSSPVPQDVVIPPRGVDFISGAVAPEININVTKSGLVIESGTARARLSTTPAENYPTFDGPGKDAKRCVVSANDLSWAVSKVLYAVSKDDRHPAHKGLCFSHSGDDTLEICALDGYRMAVSRINCTADGDFKFVLPAATAKAIDTLGLDGSVNIERDRKKAIFSDDKYEVKSRLIAEPFLDYAKVTSQKYSGAGIVVDRKDLLGVLGRVKLARSADAKDKSVLVMDFEPGGTGRASMRSAIAQMREEFDFQGELEDPVRIGFNLDFLSEALKSMEADKVKMQLNGSLSPIKLVEPHYEAFVLPVKVRSEE